VYDILMKYIFLAIFVLFAAQPFQASSCDMHDAQGISHTQHGDKQDHNMADMDCCDHDPADSSDNCDSMSHCGAGSAGFATMDSSLVNVAYTAPLPLHFAYSSQALSKFNSPPFRPPIA